ncbi:NUDIX hydrolase [Pseudahrensia aquimaris]|uniref:NUDIX hydrolase n=1 Tax=Pseudahrensia aquimaris TaxID=744461 RepID=A0ABW3FKI4_9HYPH
MNDRAPKILSGGMTRDEMDEAAAMDGSKRSPNMPPRDASTLIVLDGKGSNPKVLMGRRSLKHKFMPGLFVFPGGRVDKFDGSAPASSELHPIVEAKIVNTLRKRPTKRRARALALASIRETYEETGLLLGEKCDHDKPIDHKDWCAFADHSVMPSLSELRLIARAITPPGRNRRFDAWFFTARAETIAHRLEELPTKELEDIHWLTLEDALKLELPVITVTVLKELQERLAADPDLKPETELPFFHLRGKQFLRDMI